jgi:5-methylcytosine-specific restriction enzyme A
MPRLSAHPCIYPGCGTLIRGRRGHCSEHGGEVRRRQDAARPSAHRRGYDRDWRQRREAFLAEHPDCMRPGCDAEAMVVDHILPLSEGGTDEEDNLQSLCKPCHDSWKQSRDRSRTKVHPRG